MSVRIQRTAVVLAEDQVVLFPGRASSKSLGGLRLAMRAKQRDQRIRERDGPLACLTLRLTKVQAASLTLRAVAGVRGACGRTWRGTAPGPTAVLATVGLALRATVRCSADSGVRAPMSPRATLKLSLDLEGALIEIDVRPAKCEDLASPEAQADRDRPRGPVTLSARGLEDPPGVRDGEWFDLRFQHPRRGGRGCVPCGRG